MKFIPKLFNSAVVYACAMASVFTVSGQTITTFAGNGVAASTGDGGLATAASFNNPSCAYVDVSGNFYVIEYSGCKIRKISPSGIVSTFAGNGVAGFGGDGGPATNASFNLPIDMLEDNAGNIFVIDNVNQRIRKINPSGIISTYAGNGALGFSGDGGPASAAMLQNPSRMSLDGAGNLFFADASNNRIRKIDAATGIITTVVGNGSPAFAGDGGLATAASLNAPLGVGFDAAGNMYIADASNHRIRKVNTAGYISTYAGNGSSTPSGDGGPATAAGMNYPNGLTVDGSCNVYFTDWYGQTVRRISTTGIITRVVGNGTAGFSGDGGPATLAELHGPNNLTFDHFFNLYVPEYHNNRVRKVSNLGESAGCPFIVVTATFNSNGSVVCHDSCLRFTSTVTGVIDSIRWKVTGGNSISAPSSDTTSICFSGSDSARVTMIVYSSTASDSISATIIIYPTPHPVVSQTGNTLAVTGGPYTTYQWYTGSSAIPGATNASYTFSTIGASYYVIVDSGGCPGTSVAITTVGVGTVNDPVNNFWMTTCGDNILLHSLYNVTTPLSVNIFDATGRRILHTAWSDGTSTREISRTDLSPGIYLVHINDGINTHIVKWLNER